MSTLDDRESVLNELYDIAHQIPIDAVTTDDAKALIGFYRVIKARASACDRPLAPVLQLVGGGGNQ